MSTAHLLTLVYKMKINQRIDRRVLMDANIPRENDP